MIIHDNLLLTRPDGNLFLMNMVTFRRKIMEAKYHDLLFSIANKDLADYSVDEVQLVKALEADGQFLTAEQVEQIEAGLQDKLVNFFAEEHRITPHLILTYSCNTRCIYCYQKDMVKNPGEYGVMTPAHIDGVDEFYHRYREMYNIVEDYHISLTGGEPLLPQTRSVLAYMFDKWPTAKFDFITNGINLAEMIEGLPLSRIGRFKISLDGVGEVHNRRRPTPGVANPFAQVIEGVEMALAQQVPVMLKITADRETIWQIPELFDFLENKGWLRNPLVGLGLTGVFTKEDGTMLDPRFNGEQEMIESQLELRRQDPRFHFAINNTFYDLSRLGKMIRRPANKRIMPRIFRCEVLTGPNYTFDPSGRIYMCSDLIGQESGVLGTYYPEIRLDTEKVMRLRERHIFRMDKCRQCVYRFICAGGCPGTALRREGDLMAPVCNYFENERLMEKLGELFL